MPRPSFPKWLKVLLGLVITALALWLSFRKLDFRVLKEALIRVRLVWVAVGLALSMFTVYALGWRWQILLRPAGQAPMGSLFRLNIVSQYANIVVPARLGEVARIYLASREFRIPGAYVTGTVVIEKFLDFFVFVALWVTVPAGFALSAKFRGYGIAVVLGILTLGLMVAVVLRPAIFLRILEYAVRLLPRRFRARFTDFFRRSLEAFRLLRNPATLLTLFLLSLVFVVGQVVTNLVLFWAFRMSLSFWAALFVLLAAQVANIPPSAPGKIGVFEYAIILALSVFAVPRGEALSYGLMLHVVAFLPKILLGFVYAARMDFSFRKRYHDADAADEKKI